MLGHQNFNTTLIYAEIPTEELRHRVNAVTTSPKKWYKNCICSWSRILGAAYKWFYRIIFHRWKKYRIDESKSKHKPNINTLVIGSIGSGNRICLKNITMIKKYWDWTIRTISKNH
jgi:hypothetical protein